VEYAEVCAAVDFLWRLYLDNSEWDVTIFESAVAFLPDRRLAL
jgi:hypothetical protein